ncbi:MAG TPA: OmpA family protein [Geobacteraceae bacterium]|nr:OmpA family protein [Geobacteraceae bacterium]
MKKIYGSVLVVLAVLLGLAACAKDRCTVVLLPDPDGKIGQVHVYNLGGSQVLREPNMATGVASAEEAPRQPEKMTEQELRETFGDALATLPSPPIHFTLYFITGTTKLTDESKELLTQIIPAIEERGSTDVSVVGHTDRVGSREDNYRLGMNRALLVQKILLSLKIAPQFIEVASHGEDNPLVKTADNIPEAKNRRVEVVVR